MEIIVETENGQRIEIIGDNSGGFAVAELNKRGKRKRIISESPIFELQGTIIVRAIKKIRREENWWQHGGIFLDGGY